MDRVRECLKKVKYALDTAILPDAVDEATFHGSTVRIPYVHDSQEEAQTGCVAPRDASPGEDAQGDDRDGCSKPVTTLSTSTTNPRNVPPPPTDRSCIVCPHCRHAFEPRAVKAATTVDLFDDVSLSAVGIAYDAGIAAPDADMLPDYTYMKL